MSLNELFSLKNKVIVVTGATGLMGRQHVKAIAAFGGIPILIDLNKNEIDSLIIQINYDYNIITSGYVVDITNENSVQLNCIEIIKKYNKIDGLINNAANNPKVEKNSITNFSRLEHYSIDNWNQDLAVGLTGSFICAKYYGAQISKNINGGVIINISSDLGLISPDNRLYQIDGLEEDEQPVKPVSYSVVKA